MVKVVVDDLPDVPPVLTSEMYSGSISEGSPAGSIVPVVSGGACSEGSACGEWRCLW